MGMSAAKVEQMARVMAVGRDDFAVLSQFYLQALERIRELEARLRHVDESRELDEPEKEVP